MVVLRAVLVDEDAVGAQLVRDRRREPSTHFTLKTAGGRVDGGRGADLAEDLRVADPHVGDAVTPGTVVASFAAETGMGEKLFCAVIA